MRKQSLLIISLAISMFLSSALHAAARSDPSMFTPTACTQILQKSDFDFELVSSDAKSFPINAEIAAEYSATLCSMREVRIALESQKLAFGMTQVIDVDASSKFLSVFTTIVNRANYQKQYLNIVSARKLSNEPDIRTQMTEFDVPDYQTFFALLDLYEVKPIITSVVAVFTLQHLEKNDNTFLDLLNTFASSPISKNALAKQLFLSRQSSNIPEGWCCKDGDSSVDFYTSVQDHIDHPKRSYPSNICPPIDPFGPVHYMPRSSYNNNPPFIDLSEKHINDLTGMQYLPKTETLHLTSNYITVIPSNAFVNCNNLRGLYLRCNQITDIAPDAFVSLTHLRRLYLSNNHLTHIASTDFVALTRLEHLCLSNNQLVSIAPESFTALTNLKSISLAGNLITNPDERARIEAEVKAASPNAIIYW